MILRELFAKFGLDFDAASFGRANGAVEGLKSAAVKLAGAFALGMIAREIKQTVTETVNLADETQKSATKLGIAADAYQELQFAADLANVSQSEFERGLLLFTKRVGDAASGNDEAAKSFASLKVSIRDASGKVRTSDDLIGSVADKMQGASSATERLRIAMEMFGAKGGAKFVELLKDGAAGLALARQEARDLGGVFSEDFQDQADAFNDNMTRVGFAARGLKIELVGALLPALVDLTNGIVRWVKANRQLVRDKVRAFIDGAAQAARALWGVLRILGAAFELVTSLVGGFRNAMIALAVAFGVHLLASIGAAVLATEAFTAAQIAARLVALGNALLIGAAFIALAAVIGLIGQEIGANFTDADGLFEKMRGKWGDLSASLRAEIGTTDNPLVKYLRFLMAEVARLVHWIDTIDDAVLKAATFIMDFFTNAGVYFDAFVARTTRALKENPLIGKLLGAGGAVVGAALGGGAMSAAPAVVAAASSLASSSTSVSVNVDASGQSLDEGKVSDLITRQVSDALTRANAEALQSLTPAMASP